MLEKGATLDGIAARVHKDKLEPQPKSGRQEYIEGLLNNV
jgi:xylose isomerase